MPSKSGKSLVLGRGGITIYQWLVWNSLRNRRNKHDSQILSLSALSFVALSRERGYYSFFLAIWENMCNNKYSTSKCKVIFVNKNRNRKEYWFTFSFLFWEHNGGYGNFTHYHNTHTQPSSPPPTHSSCFPSSSSLCRSILLFFVCLCICLFVDFFILF